MRKSLLRFLCDGDDRPRQITSSRMREVESGELVKSSEKNKCKLISKSKGVGEPILCTSLRVSLSWRPFCSCLSGQTRVSYISD